MINIINESNLNSIFDDRNRIKLFISSSLLGFVLGLGYEYLTEPSLVSSIEVGTYNVETKKLNLKP